MGSEEETYCPRKKMDLFRKNKLDFCTKKLRKAAMRASLWCWFAKKWQGIRPVKKNRYCLQKKHGFITLGNVTFSCQFYVCCLTVITNSSSNYGKLPWTCRFGTTDREQGIGVFVSELFSISLLTIDNIYIHDSANFPNIITIDGVESHVLLVS